MTKLMRRAASTSAPVHTSDPMGSDSYGRVCLIMGTFNRADYIEECLESLLGQTRPIDQIIVVDDGSTDDTAKRISRFGDRVSYIFKQNGGKSSALNLGLLSTDSEWVWFFDDDDVAEPDALERMLGAIAADAESSFAYSAHCIGYDGPDRRIKRGRVVRLPRVEADLLFNYALKEFPSLLQGMLIRRRCLEHVGVFDLRYARGQDYEFIVRLARLFRGAPVDKPTVVWRQHPGSRGPERVQHSVDERHRTWMKYAQMMGHELRQQLALSEYLCPRQQIGDLSPALKRQALIQRMTVMASKGLIAEMIDDLRTASQIALIDRQQGFSASEASACWKMPTYDYFRQILLDSPSDICSAIIAAAGKGGRDIIGWIARGMLWAARHAELPLRDRWALLWRGVRLLVAAGRWPRRW